MKTTIRLPEGASVVVQDVAELVCLHLIRPAPWKHALVALTPAQVGALIVALEACGTVAQERAYLATHGDTVPRALGAAHA